MRTLYEVSLYKQVNVSDVQHVSLMKRRLFDLGFMKGSVVIPVLNSTKGDMCAYFVKGSIVALRKEDALKIIVSEDKEEV